MNSVNVENAKMQERSTIREAVLKLPVAVIDYHPKVIRQNNDELISRSAVLKILRP